MVAQALKPVSKQNKAKQNKTNNKRKKKTISRLQGYPPGENIVPFHSGIRFPFSADYCCYFF